MSLEDIVNVQISRNTVSVSRAGFGTALIVGPNAPYSTARTAVYTSIAAMVSAGYATTDEEYIAASKLFAQNPSPTRVKTGRIDVGDADLTATLNAIVNEDNDWYALIVTDHTKANQLLAAAWTETQRKIYCLSSDEAAIVDTTDGADSTSIAAQLKASSYLRSCLLYSAVADTQFPEAAALGRILPLDPGSYTLKFKTLAGITVDSLTATQKTNALAKYCNTYTTIGGVNIVEEGKVSGNEWLDTIVFIDWCQARITEGVYGVYVNNDKLPYTDAGIAAHEAEIAKVGDQGIAQGGVSPYAEDSDGNQIGGYFIVLPKLEDISAADKNNRILNGVKFTFYLAGAIHASVINGIVTV